MTIADRILTVTIILPYAGSILFLRNFHRHTSPVKVRISLQRRTPYNMHMHSVCCKRGRTVVFQKQTFTLTITSS